MKPAQWVMSEAGSQSLMHAGITIGWLKAWLMSAGAASVSMHWLESNTWQDSDADWQIIFAMTAELKNISQAQGQHQHTLLLPIGDIAYQRHRWLAVLNDGKALAPLYVRADDSLSFALESGMSASLNTPSDGQYLNAQGLLIEEQVIATLKQQKLSIRTVESCTAGSIAARLCRVPGASDVLDRAWLTYSNAAKQEEVGVAASLLKQHGAVSREVVVAMAEGGCDASHVCIASSGIAGPGGGTKDKPVGTVWIAIAMKGNDTLSQCLHLSGARHDIQARTVIESLCLLQRYIV
ncbi:MAG: CinA family protein [Mariprofundus sp.]|nr:CinA family protein [Mariprofundus sp.]